MADMEGDTDFGSHFLDSMLEVEMTEEDNELDVSKNDDPLGSLPPIPTFDLQSETLSYKEIYRNPVPQPVLTTIPMQTPSTAPSVPLVIKPNSMLIYRSEVQPVKATTVLAPLKKLTKLNAKPIAPKSVNSTPPTSLPSLPSPPAVATAAKVAAVTAVASKAAKDRFMDEVFKPEFFKNVFVKADSPSDLSTVSEEEMNYYKSCFKDVKKVQDCRLHCTICDRHLGCSMAVEKKINIHSVLKVLTCKPCFEFYGDGNFPCDKGDNCEIYCRWCGQGGALVCCSFCPRVFCKKCVRRNYGPSFLRKIERASDWACFCCAQKPLWPLRAICRALLEFISQKKSEPKTFFRDTSSCCKVSGISRKKASETLEKKKLVKVVASQPQPQQQSQPIKVAPGISLIKNKTYPPLKAKNDQLELNPVVRLKPTDRVKGSVNPNTNSKPPGLTNILSSRSILDGNKIIRGISRTPAKLFSSFPSPQLIQAPVLHGETLITPPTRFLVQANPPPPQAAPTPVAEPPYVKVTLTHQPLEWDINKVPTVKIPQGVQGLVLRLVFPDNKVQYIRLASEGKTSREFPMPQFKESGGTFIEDNLAEAFETSKMFYDKLMRIRDKVNSRTKFTEESVFNSSVKKLHLAYEQTVQVLKDLDGTLLESHEDWKNEGKNFVDVIDISDDESAGGKKTRHSREKCKKTTEESEVEILEDVIVNGTTPTNYKERYRLKKPKEQEKTPPLRKRRRGRVRGYTRKPKVMKLQNGQPEEDPLKMEPVEKNIDIAAEFNLEEDTLLDEPESEGKVESLEERQAEDPD